MQSITEFVAPQSVEEAVGILRERSPGVCVLAGGTDVMVRLKRDMMPEEKKTLLSVHGIAAMRGCRREGKELVVGAATTATELIRDPLLAESAPILAQVADRLASAQIRNQATLGGNLVNASPAGDLINPLLLLDARLILVSAEGRRDVPVAEFFTGPGESVLRPDELLTEVRFDIPPAGRIFRFEKAGTRPSMECSVVTVGVAFTPDGDKIKDVRVAFGSSAPTPLRGRDTEAALEGGSLTPETIAGAGAVAEKEVSPISDVRGSDCYRRALVGVFLGRLLSD